MESELDRGKRGRIWTDSAPGRVAVWASLVESRLVFGRPGPLRPAPAGPECSHFACPERLSNGGLALSGVVTRPLRDAFVRNGSSASAVLLWFGGRNEDIAWTPAIAGWLGPEFAVASFAYRGHSGSGGHASQAAVVDDGLRIVRWLQQEERFEGARLLIAGRSLGSAVAMQVLARLDPVSRPVSGLILLSPMESLRGLLRAHRCLAPASRWLSSPFDSLAVVGAVRCPVQVLLAARDKRVPHAHSWRLVEAIAAARSRPPVLVQTLAGTDHRTLPRSAAALLSIRRFAQDAISGAPVNLAADQPSSPQPVATRR